CGSPRMRGRARRRTGACRRSRSSTSRSFARFLKTVTRQRAVENHPLSARLVFEELFLGYRELFASP
ncbi:DNA polymerase III subunit delta', partial [Burkholderia pseudomallei]